MDNWQPRETAPKDGTPFLAAFPCGAEDWIIESIRWVENWGEWSLSGVMLKLDIESEDEHFKFWQPLPEPPVTA